MLKNNLFNRKNKYQLIHSLDKEQFERTTCSFYRYIKINDLINIRNQLYTKLIELHCLGRIYIAREGINAQVSVPTPNWDAFIYILDSFIEFNNMHIKPAVTHSKYSFIKLIVRVKNKIVADGLKDDLVISPNEETYLSATEFNEAMDDPNSIVVDMRNYYESEVGHFDDAICPDAATFKELLPIVKEMLNNKKRNKLLLYCTGGIRCEKASAYLKYHNFEDVNQLQGGIISYSQQVKEDNLECKFKGKNFVFDARMGENITDDIISKCHQCEAPSNRHTNCNNQACHILFIQCKHCETIFNNCCSKTCSEIAAKPLDEQRILRKNPLKAAPLRKYQKG
ncbi:uncharacterized protein METZ01_LOCUS253443, partial [marine metagenome]